MLVVSKILSTVQVTIPYKLRKKLNLTEGCNAAIITAQNKRVYLANSSMLALKDVQSAFAGAAEEAGLQSEDDVAAFLKSV